MMQRWRITFPPNIITVIEMGDDRIANGYLIRPPFAKWTTIQRFKIISSYSLWKFSQWEKREYNEQRLKSFNVVHSFLNNRQERKKKDTVEFQAENNKLIIGSRGIDRISRWAEFPWTGQKHRGEADGGFFTGGRETNDVLNFVGREERRRKNRGGSRKTG